MTGKIFTYFISLVWLVNGLFCKVLNLVPRHEQIVARILDEENSRLFTFLIGISEILMTLWVLTGIKKRLNSILQIIIIAFMNVLEYILVPDLLLWGKFNSFFAFLFIMFIWYNEFILGKKLTQKT